MAQLVKALLTKPHKPRTHSGSREPAPTSCPLTPDLCTVTSTHTALRSK
ncbi:mCG1035262 [Mus musculus]|nr:mCG1035262 [Mus musculus]